MVKFNRYEEFNDGKIKLSVPSLPDEKKMYGDDTIEVELLITAAQAQDLKGMTKAYPTLVEIMDVSYPNMKKESKEAFIIRHADDLLEKFMLWSGVTQEKIDEFKKMQETIIADFMKATPEERKDFLQSKVNDDSDKSR